MIVNAAKIHQNLSQETLVKMALDRQEGILSDRGALVVETGERSGRSPKDRFIVEDNITRTTIDWGKINLPISQEAFAKLWQRALNHIADKEVFVSDLSVGADASCHIPVAVITELACHNLFAQHLFIKPDNKFAPNPTNGWTILNVPTLSTDPQRDGVNSDATGVLNFSERKILLIGLRYAGEMKKAMFTVMNYFLPEKRILPMHCAANMGKDRDVALFFGLSGTGKTTLSADPKRFLIGDDEHGWSSTGVFNFEGGCYAKCIDLSKESEPVIWDAIRDGAIMENVVVDQNGVPDFHDARLTQNTRAAYPRDFIPNCVPENCGAQPKAVLFLTCDLYGVLPPISLLTKEQAAYHFLSGYTAHVGSTEVGEKSGVRPIFSTCFGAPFFPRPASVYAELLMQRIVAADAQVYLINTGWTGGSYGEGGKRFSIPLTRAVVEAAISGEAKSAKLEKIDGFNLQIPTVLSGVDSQLLNPINTWSDKQKYYEKLNELTRKFADNFQKFKVSGEISSSGPIVVEMAK